LTQSGFQEGDLIENRYRVLDMIGSGGMGTLYRVSDEAKKGDVVVALKTVSLEEQATEMSEERFQREFQLLTQLRHPNLVSVHEYGVTAEGELYFTMEWVQGGDLNPDKRPLEPGATIPTMVQICRALAYLHARGVIHGDLKPHNVLLAGYSGERVKLVDFGLALEVRSAEARARYYTPGYSAPEVKQLRPADHRMDLYSLGAMWYALLVGEPPIFMPGPGKERLIRFALEEALQAQSQIPIALGEVIARLMATAPDDRYSSANQVIEAVNEVTGSTYELETRETVSSYALRTRFVNRETEIEVLRTAWGRAKNSNGGLTVISGESGVGKTRLLEELELQAELEGARVVWGQCVERGGSAYRPWREVLRVLLRYVEGADEAELDLQRVGPVLAAILPELWEREYMAGLEPPAELDPQAAQRRLQDGIVRALRAAARLRPTVVMIEDAQWADEATLELLLHLARVPGSAGLLTCITYRSEEVEAQHPLTRLRGEGVQHVKVEQLTPKVTTDLARSMLGLEELPLLLTERLQQTTGGNALFVQELIRSLAAEEEVLRRTVEGWQVDGEALKEARLPESIQQVVERRLGQLSPETRQVLLWAAVVGMVFWEEAAAEVGQVTRARVRAGLREGLEQELIVVRDESSLVGEREYLFNNPTVREVVLESVPPQERQGCHGRAAAWLMGRSEDEVEEHLGLIAGHLEEAGRIEQAALYLRRAGEQAAERFSNAEAVGYLSRALDLTPEDNLMERYALLLAREKVYDLQGMREAQARDLAALEELAEGLDDDVRRAEAALRQANYADMTGDYPAAIATARTAVGLAQKVGDTNQEAAAYMRWGGTLWRQGKYEAAKDRLEQALALAQAASVRRVEADSLRYLGLVSWNQGDHSGAGTYFEQALHIYREIGDPRYESGTLNNLGLISIEQGNSAEGRRYCEQALQIFRDIGERRGEGLLLGNLGVLYDQQGNYAQARTYYEQSLRIRREIDDRIGECMALTNMGLLFHNLGDDEAAKEHSQQGLRIAQEIGERRWQGFALTNLGHALEGQGLMAEAAQSYRQAVEIRGELGERNLAIESLAGLARASLGQKDLSLALTHVEEILDHLEDKTLDGTDEPFRIYLTCYRVLRANQDPRAQDVLAEAHRLLQERAARISDEETRRLFLENVTAHREIVEAWESR